MCVRTHVCVCARACVCVCHYHNEFEDSRFQNPDNRGSIVLWAHCSLAHMKGGLKQVQSLYYVAVHITVWHSLFVYFVNQCIHFAIPKSARFLFRNLFWRYATVFLHRMYFN